MITKALFKGTPSKITDSLKRAFGSCAISRNATQRPAMLNYKLYKSTSLNGNNQTLIALHGLLGSSANFRGICKNPKISGKTDYILLDQRNHGKSETRSTMLPSEMANDLAHFIQAMEISTPITLMGHSMGGIVAMTAAVLYPQLFQSLIIVDIAPLDYFNSIQYFQNYHELEQLLGAMQMVDLSSATTLAEVEQQLNLLVQDFCRTRLLLSNIEQDQGGKFKWHTEPEVFLANLGKLTSEGYNGTFEKPVKIIAGDQSEYMNNMDEAIQGYKKIFPKMDPSKDISIIEGAGHWVQYDKPKEFIQVVSSFL